MARKRTHDRRRIGSGAVNLYGHHTSLGWPIIGRTTRAEGAAKTAAGEWEPVAYEGSDIIAGYHVLAKPKTDSELPSHEASRATITLREMQLNADGLRRSRTARLSEDTRSRMAVPEDAVERAVAKVRQWPWPASRIDDGKGKPIFGDRAVRAYPKAPPEG